MSRIWLVVAGLAVVCGGILLLKLPPLAAALDGPRFCGSCHVMETEVASYLHSAHRETAECGDCHLPHALVQGAFYKAYTGTRDVIGVMAGVDPGDIALSPSGKGIVHGNCLRCHGEMAGVIGDTRRGGGMYCFECHRYVPHLK